MTATAAKVEYVAFGEIDAMIAEYGACDMGGEWFERGGYKFAVLPIGEAQFTTEYFETIEDAKACAKEIAAYHGCKIASV